MLSESLFLAIPGAVSTGPNLSLSPAFEAKKDNKLQEWLACCHFGNGPEKYPDADTQEAEHKLSIA